MSYKFDWKKRALYLGYQEQDRYPCYLTDSITPYSPYFNISNLPEKLTGGKNLFRIDPTENTLQIGSEVLVEVADSFGNAIYTEVTGIIDDQYHLVSIWVYSDFPTKQVTLTILGTAIRDMDGSSKRLQKGRYPDTGEPWWNGKRSINPRLELARPNIRWQRPLIVEADAPNTTPIQFSFMPKIRINEKIKTYFSQSYTGERVSGSIQSASYSNPSGIMLINPSPEELRKGFNYPRVTVPAPFFSGSMVGGTIKFQGNMVQDMNPRVLTGDLAPGNTLNYQSTIHSVVNSTTVKVYDPYQMSVAQTFSNQGSKSNPGVSIGNTTIIVNKQIESFNLSAMQITHSNPPSYSDTENSESYALCEFKNVSPVAGDVHRMVTKIKSHGKVGDYEVVGDHILETTQLFADTGSTTMAKRWGVIETDTDALTYWSGSGHGGGLSPSMSRGDEWLMDGLLVGIAGNISGEKYVLVSSTNHLEFNEGTTYKLSFESFLKRTPNSTATSGYDPLNVKVFLSGSGFTNTTGDPDPDLGLLIGDMASSQSATDQFTFDAHFTATRTGFGKPVFKIDAAHEVHLSDISLIAETDSGFTPEEFSIISYIPTLQNDDILDFKFEMYNYDNVKASIDLHYDAVDFSGGNLFINNALLSGQMGIGKNMAAAGFVMAGNKSAYLRTVGPEYPGFLSASAGSGSGLLMWSGSIGTTLYDGSGDDYKGIGMEMVLDSSSYFRFRTDPSELDIRAKKFFVGDDTTNFISGALGNIEISSSDFHLKPDGSIIMAGQITATAGGTVGGWHIGESSLTASNIILSSSGTMQTADFESSLLGAGVGKGWKIDSSGEAEFENAKIRGTLRTAVFEKDTISAVGGAVIIANATVTTGSDLLSGSMNGIVPDMEAGVPSASIPVESIGGFVAGEYLIAKSIQDTGFTNELMQVYSSSTNPTTLHVSRSLNGNTIPTMSAAQVIVSYAAEDQGFIFMNATSGSDTPFIDIMERTGSGHYDIETKVRLGDLSGLNASKVGTNPGHGLFGQNVFLTGKLEASVLSGQVVEVVNSNFTQYLSASVEGGGYTLVLDGSAGGSQALNVIITETNSVDPLVIKGILAPDVTNATNVDVNVEIGEEVTAAISIDPDSGGVAGATMKVNVKKFWSAAQSNAIQSNVAQVISGPSL